MKAHCPTKIVICKKCKNKFNARDFKNRDSVKYCNNCSNEIRRKEYYSKNKNKIYANIQRWRKKHPKKVKLWNAKHRGTEKYFLSQLRWIKKKLKKINQNKKTKINIKKKLCAKPKKLRSY